MFGIGSRTFYALYNGNIIFNFEAKVDRDYFVSHSLYAECISATEAWKHKNILNKVNVPASYAIGRNPYRQKTIAEWRSSC